MKTIFTLILTCISFCGRLTAQSAYAEASEVEELFSNKRFASVWPYYQDLLKKDSSNSEFNYKMGMCYLNSRSQKEKAVKCFKKVVSSSTEETITVTGYKLLAEAAYATSNFDLAIENYEKYRSILIATKGSSQGLIDEATRKIELSKISKELKDLKELMATLINNKFSEPGKTSVTSSAEYTASASPDQSTLTFVFKRPAGSARLNADNEYFEDLYTFSPVETPKALKNPDTSSVKKEATVATSVDGQIMLIYKDDEGVANIYTSFLIGNTWSRPEKLDNSINIKGWETDEFVSADGKELYFTSSRPGGFGGKDIYKSVKLDNGEWSRAINLGPKINSSFDEEAPFAHPDGVTLFYSSDRYRKKGVFDVFMSTSSDSGWTEPRSVGYPEHKIESEGPTNKKRSKNEDEEKAKEKIKNDNCTVTFINRNKTPITLVKGKILDIDGKIPKYIEITVRNTSTGEITGVYHCSSRTGQYQFIAPPGKNNYVVFESAGYLFHSENIDISRETDFYRAGNTIILMPLKEGSKNTLNNIFFDDGKSALNPGSHVELDKLFDFLNANPKMEIEIASYIDKGNPIYNTKLFEERLQAVLNYLIEKGIPKERLDTNVYNFQKKGKRKKHRKTDPEEITAGKIQMKITEIN